MMRKTIGTLAILALAGCYQVTPIGDPDDPRALPSDPPPTVPPVPGVASVPAIAGGALIVTGSDIAVLADPEHAAIWMTDLETLETTHVTLFDDDEPGRLVEDGAGRVHVVLRRAGALLGLDPSSGEVLGRREVCSAPRGIDWEASSDLLHVACADGSLVSLPAAGGAPVRELLLDDDLRDVVAADGVLYVSRFRSAELLTVDASGTVVDRARPTDLAFMTRIGEASFTPNVAWRLRAMPGGGVAMLHQRALSSAIDVERDGYMGLPECPTGVVAPAITIFDGGSVRGAGLIAAPALLVDFVVSADGSRFHAASAAEGRERMMDSGPIVTVGRADLESLCAVPDPGDIGSSPATGVALRGDGSLVSFRRSSGELHIGSTSVPVAPEADFSPGHELFHRVTFVGLACASCHPEGGEDGHTWDFSPVGPRRTQTLLGGMSGHEPFHWNGDQADMTAIMTVTFGERMLGAFDDSDVRAMQAWLDAQPTAPGVVRDADAVSRGRTLFESPSVGCTSCHSGEAMTNDRNEDVGTGRDFQVPSLRGVMHRAPFFHDGCAPSLDTVVAGGCGTLDTHGRTSSLDASERADLVAYLRSL